MGIIPSIPDNQGGTLPQSRGLIGRSREQASLVHELLAQGTRWITLTGPGGVGKTVLAEHAVSQMEDHDHHNYHYLDGVVRVSLAEVRDPDLVLPTIASALGLEDVGSDAIRDRLIAWLQPRQLLLLLDNLEHLLPAVADIAAIVTACPDLMVLATSRTRLACRDERVVEVRPFSLPDETASSALGYPHIATLPAVQLYVLRARLQNPNFLLTSENAREILAICRSLDGLPLAIELAAAQSHLVHPAEMMAQLPHLSLPDGERPDRLRSLSQATAWSLALLPAGDRSLFRTLGIFVGGFTLGFASFVAAEVSSSAIEAGIERLAEAHLIVPMPSVGAARRWRMLEPIRAVALDELDAQRAASDTRRRHAEFIARELVRQEDILTGSPVAPNAFAWFLDELGNHRSALAWAIAANEADLAGRIAGGSIWFWYLGGFWNEAVRALQQVRAITEVLGETWTHARILLGIGTIDVIGVATAEGLPSLTEATRIFHNLGDARSEGFAQCMTGLTAINAGDDTLAVTAGEEAVRLLRTTADRWGLALGLNSLGDGYLYNGRLDDAERVYRESLGICQEIGNIWGNLLLIEESGLNRAPPWPVGRGRGYRATSPRPGEPARVQAFHGVGDASAGTRPDPSGGDRTKRPPVPGRHRPGRGPRGDPHHRGVHGGACHHRPAARAPPGVGPSAGQRVCPADGLRSGAVSSRVDRVASTARTTAPDPWRGHLQ
ncbi:MAG: NB-ARC domain-containing protein [Thermomicrobiales bacterium]